MIAARSLLIATVALAAPMATACSVFISKLPYMNVVDMKGPKVGGLKWVRIYNILDYQGEGRIMVSGIRNGGRFLIAKWENGQECAYDARAVEKCEPNRPFQGINLQGLFDDWGETAARDDHRAKVVLRLIVQTADGREHEMTLRSRTVRTTRKLHAERAEMISTLVCKQMDE